MRERVSVGSGFLLMAFGGLIPFIVPQRDQTEVMVITLFLMLVGAMMVYSGYSGPPGAPTPAFPARWRLWVLSLALALLAIGLLLPILAVGTRASADMRFLWMVAFAPAALIGTFLLWRLTPEPIKDRLRGQEEAFAATTPAVRPSVRSTDSPRLRRWVWVAIVVMGALLALAMALTLLITASQTGVGF